MEFWFIDEHTLDTLIKILIPIGIIASIIFGIRHWRKPKIVQKTINEIPIIQIVNFGIEPPQNPNQPTTDYHPNIRNDGKVSVSNVKIYYKVMHRVVELRDIIRDEDVRKACLPYEGSILPNQSARINAIQLPKTHNEISVIFWIEYNFDENESNEIIYDIRFSDWKKSGIRTYLKSDIGKTKKRDSDERAGNIGAPT